MKGFKAEPPEISRKEQTKDYKPERLYSEYYKGFFLATPESEDYFDNGTHVIPILDSIIEMIKWICARHAKVLLIRYDYYLADSDIDISQFNTDFFKNLKKCKHKARFKKIENTFSDIQYIWVREKGTDVRSKGIHYHCVIAFRMPNRLKVEQVNNEIRRISNKVLQDKIGTKIAKLKESKKSVVKKIKALEKTLDELKKYIESDGTYKFKNAPYVKINGFHRLERSMLSISKSEQQREDIAKRVVDNEGYKYLRTNIITERKKNKYPVGGILEECIYGISYISKVVSKEFLEASLKSYGRSTMKDRKLDKGRKEQIQKHTNELEVIFSEYEKATPHKANIEKRKNVFKKLAKR